MFVNLTIYALYSTFYSHSPMISPSSYSATMSMNLFHRIQMKNFFSHFFLDQSNLASITFTSSSFIKFLNTPIAVRKVVTDEYKLINKKDIKTQHSITGRNKLTVIGCTFSECNANNENRRGGAIFYSLSKGDGIVSIYSSTFEKCRAINGDGGAIFVCGVEKETSYDPSHEECKSFESKYCCYSKCIATGDKEFSGYGQVMFVFANFINISYSTSVECLDNNDESYAAQFDVKSYTIESCFINCTKGMSKYCCAIEYRKANQGTFQFQTFVDLKGCYLTSFSELEGGLTISNCNYINNTIKSPKLDQKGAFIYLRKNAVYISDFCFVDIKIESDFSFVHFTEAEQTITIENSFIEKKYENYLSFSNIKTNNIIFYNEDGEKYTNKIELLLLGPCEGEIAPPPTIFSSTFTPTSPFSSSDAFSESYKFTNSQKFVESSMFTSSQKFTESYKFASSQKFTESYKFTSSQKFTESYKFTSSQKFTESYKFTSSQKFTDSNSFSNTKKFIETNHVVGNIENNDKGLPKGSIAGIAVAAAAVVVVIVAFVIIKLKRRPKFTSAGFDLDLMESSKVNTANPIYGEGEDDPFKEDFQ